jgi:AhpD family alkylhydroperoxidase
MARMLIGKVEPAGYKAINPLYEHCRDNVEPRLHELIKIRASQLNGCAYCIDLHTRDARALGESEQRIYALNAWRETPFFDEREQAVLALTEAATKFSAHGVPDDVYDAAADVFSEVELANIILAIGLINFWNRIGITCGMQPKRRD